jgi:hypothetical protein
MTGFEPATSGATVRRSTAELHPPLLAQVLKCSRGPFGHASRQRRPIAGGLRSEPVPHHNAHLSRRGRPAKARCRVERQELERIARAALKELGVPNAELTVTEDSQRPGHWCLDLRGAERRQLRIRCSAGTSPQFVREQVFEQFAR